MESKKRKIEEDTANNKGTTESKGIVSEEEIAELAEHLNKEQLINIVKQAASLHADVLSQLQKAADQDTGMRKIFVRGLSWSTDDAALKKAFQEYGFVKKAVVIVDKNTGKSRGFGFVKFRHRDAAIRALKEPTKTIEDRKVLCHLSGAREAATAASTVAGSASAVSSEPLASRKVYVGHLPKSMKKDILLSFFSQYGDIELGPLGFDKTGECRGWAILIYKTQEATRKCLMEPEKTINGHKVHCKLAADSQKRKDEGAKLPDSATQGYELTNSALIAAHNPSFLQSSSQSLGQSHILPARLSSLHGLDPFLSRGSSLLGSEAAYSSSTLSSLYGPLPSNHATLSSSYPSLTSLHNSQVSGYSSLPRSSFYEGFL